MSKYKLSELRKREEYNEIEELLAQLDLKKRQYDVYVEHIIPYEKQIKEAFKDSISQLINARNSILKTFMHIDSLEKFLKESTLFTKEQIEKMDDYFDVLKFSTDHDPMKIWGITKNEKPILFTYPLRFIIPKREFEATSNKQLQYKYILKEYQIQDDMY